MNLVKKNILIYAPGGVGIWHINRVCWIFSGKFSEAFRWSITILTDSREKDFIVSHGFEYEYFEYALEDTLKTISFDDFEVKLSKKILKIYKQKQIDSVFFDTFFPIHFFSHVYSHSSYLILRNTSSEHMNSISKYFHKFRKIYIPHETDEFSRKQKDILSHSDNTEYIWRVVNPDFLTHKIYKKEKKQILISPWYGWDSSQTQDFIEYCIRISQNIKDYNIVIFTGANDEVFEYFSKNYEYKSIKFSYKKYLKYFQESEIILSRSGYNSANELYISNKKWILFSSPREYESQDERSKYFANKSENIFSATNEWDKDIENLSKLLINQKVERTTDIDINFQEDFKNSFLKESQKKTLCVYKHIFLPQSEYFIYSELRELKKTYHLVILCLKSEEFIWNDLSFYEVPWLTEVLNPDYPLWVSSEIQSKFLQTLWGIMRRIGSDVCYTEFLFDMMLIYPLKDVLKIPFISAWRGNDIYNILRKLPKQKRERMFEKIDQILVRDINMFQSLIWMWIWQQKVSICRSYLDIDIYETQSKKFKKLDVLIWGRFVAKKRIQKVIELVSKMRDFGILGRVGLIWDGPESTKIFKEIRKHKLDSLVETLWLIEHSEYRKILKEYNCYISYSLKSKNGDDEWVPNILIENSMSGNMIATTITWWIAEVYNDMNACILTGSTDTDINIIIEYVTRGWMEDDIERAQIQIKKIYSKENSLWILETYL